MSEFGIHIAINLVIRIIGWEKQTMKNLRLRALATVALATLAITAATVSTKYLQGFSQDDMYVMPEPFSSGSLVTYSSLESSTGDS